MGYIIIGAILVIVAIAFAKRKKPISANGGIKGGNPPHGNEETKDHIKRD